MFLAAAVQIALRRTEADAGHEGLSAARVPGPADPRSNEITIQQLLDHTAATTTRRPAPGSIRRTTCADRAEPRAGQPVTKLDVAQYMYGKPLDFTPGTNNQYSNFGYLLAGAVVEKVTGMTFFNYVKTTLLQAAGITEVEVFPTLASGRTTIRPSRKTKGSTRAPSISRRTCWFRRCTEAPAKSTKSAIRTPASPRPPTP